MCENRGHKRRIYALPEQATCAKFAQVELSPARDNMAIRIHSQIYSLYKLVRAKI